MTTAVAKDVAHVRARRHSRCWWVWPARGLVRVEISLRVGWIFARRHQGGQRWPCGTAVPSLSTGHLGACAQGVTVAGDYGHDRCHPWQVTEWALSYVGRRAGGCRGGVVRFLAPPPGLSASGRSLKRPGGIELLVHCERVQCPARCRSYERMIRWGIRPWSATVWPLARAQSRSCCRSGSRASPHSGCVL